jgi:hypothetical protein
MKMDALRIAPGSGRITVTGNNFSNSDIGEGGIKRQKNDIAAAGMTLNGASDVAITGNLFASVRPKAVELVGDPSRRILFADNVLTDVTSDHGKLKDSIIENILQSPPVEESAKAE